MMMQGLTVKKKEEDILLKDLGESRHGKISSPIIPLQMFVLARVALALKAAPDEQENELLNFISGFSIMAPFDKGISSVSVAKQIRLALLHCRPKLTLSSLACTDVSSEFSISATTLNSYGT